MAGATTERKEEVYKIIEEQKQSGLSQINYCKVNGIAISTFCYWHKKYKKEKGLDSLRRIRAKRTISPAFLPIEITNSSLSNPNDLIEQIEILYPNGVKLTCPLETRRLKLQELIQLV